MNAEIVLANPSGNITALVKTNVAPTLRRKVAAALMRRDNLKIQQVAFITPPRFGAQGRIEMAGGEFCGNALRCFGYYLASQRGESATVRAEISGIDEVLSVAANLITQSAQASMPVPHKIESIVLGANPSYLVWMQGIVHAVVYSAPDPTLISELSKTKVGLQKAFGIMFLQKETMEMTPLVHVTEIATTVWEGSCASGSVAAAAVLSRELPGGLIKYTLSQPAGAISVSVFKETGHIRQIILDGKISFEECTIKSLEIDE